MLSVIASPFLYTLYNKNKFCVNINTIKAKKLCSSIKNIFLCNFSEYDYHSCVYIMILEEENKFCKLNMFHIYALKEYLNFGNKPNKFTCTVMTIRKAIERSWLLIICDKKYCIYMHLLISLHKFKFWKIYDLGIAFHVTRIFKACKSQETQIYLKVSGNYLK